MVIDSIKWTTKTFGETNRAFKYYVEENEVESEEDMFGLNLAKPAQ